MKGILKITLWVYFPRFKNVNQPKKLYSRTIYMCNHAASFMDPLAVVGSQSPIMFFMTRSDIFTPVMRPVLWASHMLPIYRQHDGVDTKKKNEEVFKKCAKILKNGRNLMVYSEGFTDNVFIRRLKPIKKGAVRIGFDTLENINWEKNVYLQAVGANYSDPNVVGSDCVVSNGDPICLNEYKAAYEEDKNKTISYLTQKMEKEMQAQITHVENADLAPFHEHIMRITRKGMNAIDSDFRIPLLERWKYSKKLANWFNENEVDKNVDLIDLKARLNAYFSKQEKLGVEETPLYTVLSNQRKKIRDIVAIVLLFPVMILGMISCYLPYKLIKSFVEKSFKRSVFWGSVKMLLGFVAIGVYNLILLILLTQFTALSAAFGFLYFILLLPIIGVVTHAWFKICSKHKKMSNITQKEIDEFGQERTELKNEIERLIPVA